MLDKLTRSASLRFCFHFAWATTLLTFAVVVLGAYTRLTDAGLGCPDWPQCYGHWVLPNNAHTINPAIQTTKAWTEMSHRYLAGSLGILIALQALLAIRNRKNPQQPVVLPLVLLALVIFQALLGMWTVTLKLYPMVVMGHLLGGLTTLSLLGCLTLLLTPRGGFSVKKIKFLKFIGAISLIILIAQLFLGGWTSANYAALVCLDFPFCSQHESMTFDFANAFDLTKAGVTGSQGEPLESAARMTIHMLHRMGALITTIIFGVLVFLIFRNTKVRLLRGIGLLIAGLLITQVGLGIINVVAVLPLAIAVAHNAVAALLLVTVVGFNVLLYLTPKASDDSSS